jgi:hypothetical protein
MMAYRVWEKKQNVAEPRCVAVFFDEAEATEYGEEYLEGDFTSFEVIPERVVEIDE